MKLIPIHEEIDLGKVAVGVLGGGGGGRPPVLYQTKVANALNGRTSFARFNVHSLASLNFYNLYW